MNYFAGLTLALLLLAQTTIGSGRGTGAHNGTVGAAVTYASGDFCDASDYTGATDTSITCTTGTVAAGDALVIVAYNAEFTTFTDSLGGTITQFTGFPEAWDSGNSFWQSFCLANAAAGTHTITLSNSTATAYVGMIVMGFHGASTTAPCTPMTTAGSAQGSSALASATVTSTMANSAVVAIAQDLSADGNPTSGYTSVNSPNADFAAEYLLIPTVGTYTASFALSATDEWLETAVVVQP